ncbi:MAG: ABC transporter permease [Peptoniphilaceae bacterium]|nr:ABC transporter permease [Peptoniphilaceae bacterium]MDY3738510.1 ABC transporter permease [Peptoniphilaceae bacterium]
MFKYIMRKLLMMIPMLLVISILIFSALQLMPVDPINYMISPDAMNNTANIEALRHDLGLDKPIPIQYIDWISGILHGDFGYSILSGEAISNILAQRFPATIQLALVSLVISSVLGIVLGIIAAVHQNGIVDYITRIIAVVGQSIPEFVFAMVLMVIFVFKLAWFPPGGRAPFGNGAMANIKPIILPAFALSIGLISTVFRYTRNSMLDVMGKEYIKTARSKGIAEWKVYLKHAFRNALGPVLVTIMLRIPALIGGSVVIETIFNWPGIGSQLMSGVSSSDYPVIMMITLVLATVLLVASFLIDVISALLDPRIRLE